MKRSYQRTNAESPSPKKNQEKGGGEMVEKDSFNLWHRHCPKAAFIPIQQ